MAKKRKKSFRTEYSREDKVREDRIVMEIVVDAYNESERRMGWYCYLENELVFPFKAVCVGERQVSPLSAGEEVEVVGLADDEECQGEMFVLVEWEDDELAVLLSQIFVERGEGKTVQAVEGWRYWVERGYQF